jgi:hypothetical protein
MRRTLSEERPLHASLPSNSSSTTARAFRRARQRSLAADAKKRNEKLCYDDIYKMHRHIWKEAERDPELVGQLYTALMMMVESTGVTTASCITRGKTRRLGPTIVPPKVRRNIQSAKD